MEIKETCKKYGNLILSPDSEFDYLYSELLEQTLIKQEGKLYKKTGISCYGNPLIYSFKYDGKESVKNLRTVMEPGGNNITVARQIDVCLNILNKFSDKLNWNIAADVNQIMRTVYPKNSKETQNWISGMWLGIDSGDKATMLKVYLNLRHQSENLRWQRIASLLGLYAYESFEKTLRFISQSIHGTGIPVGLGCAIGENGLMGVRIYVAFQKIDSQCIHKICEEFYPGHFNGIDHFIKLYLEIYGDIQSSVLNFDFVLNKEKILIDEPVRIKAEISTCNLHFEKQKLLKLLIRGQMKYMGYNYMDFENDLLSAYQYFDKVFFQYLSVGLGKKGEHFTTYFEPVTTS